MIINIQPLPRRRTLSQTPIDLRQLVILGPLTDSPHYPEIPFPIAADLRPQQPKNAQWTGAIVLGGTTELLTRHWGDKVQFCKICTYTGATAKNPLPYVMEYLSVIDPQGYHLFYKCRKRSGPSIISYVFPENIDKYAHGLTQKSWYETPLVSLLVDQSNGYLDNWTHVANTFFESIEDNVNSVNLLTPDNYNHIATVSEINSFIHDFYRLVQSACNPSDYDDVYDYWLNRSIPILKEKDIFLQHILMSNPMTYQDLIKWQIPSVFDLSTPDPLWSYPTEPYTTFPQCYLPIAERLEKLPHTDLSMTMLFNTKHKESFKIEYATNRFASLYLPLTSMGYMLHDLCMQLYHLYHIHNPLKVQSLILIRIEKSFNEEGLLEFVHRDDTLDHAIYIDFALLSYCSPGLGRFFNRIVDKPF